MSAAGPGGPPRRPVQGHGGAQVATAERVLVGALAGIAGTVAMTIGMRAMHRRLPGRQRYPLPPREIIEEAIPAPTKGEVGERGRQAASLAAHFGYGAATGALYALARPQGGIAEGALYGVLIWAGSYFGLMPGLRLLKPAHRHAGSRNLLMIGAHVIWGGTVALTVRELEGAQREIFATGLAPDRARPAIR